MTVLADRVDTFLADNPTFVTALADRTRQFLYLTGSSTVGMQAMVESIRWDRLVETNTDSFKVNNSFEPYLARAVMAEHPDLDGVYRLRRAPDATAWAEARYGLLAVAA